MSTSHPVRAFVILEAGLFELSSLEGEERVSTTSPLRARFIAPPGTPDPAAILRTRAMIVVGRSEHAPDRTIAGIVTEASLGLVEMSGAGAELELVIEAPLSLARWRVDSRVFRNLDAVAIVRAVLARYRISPELRLSRDYPVRAYCVQRRESDLDFVMRLLEDEGIFYFHLDDGRLVLADHPAAYQSIDSLPNPGAISWRTGFGLDGSDEAIIEIERRATVAPSSVTLRDFTVERPSFDLSGAAALASAVGAELYDYPGEFSTPEEGARKAGVRAGELAIAAERTHGRGTSVRPRPGHTFVLEGAPSDADGTHCVVSVTHDYHVARGAMSIAFEAIDADRCYRPPRVTPEPRILNPITGIVCGPPGEDVHTDEVGRVKVRFHWDRLQPFDDSVSDWVPILQDNTGHSVAIPRVGWEVAVHFLEGDPDRPVVLGRVYNGADPFPEALPDNKTVSSLKSVCSPGRDGTNMIRFEDKAGAEQIRIQAEKDQNVVVANDKKEEVISTESTTVGRNETISIGANDTRTIGKDSATFVTAAQTWTVGADRSRKVGADESAQVNANRTLKIGGMHRRRVGADDLVTVKDLSERVGAVTLEASLKEQTTKSGKSMSVKVGGAFIEIARKNKKEKVTLARVETVGGVELVKAAAIATQTMSRSTLVGGALKMSGKAGVTLDGGGASQISAGMATLDGSASLTIEVGASRVVLEGGTVTVSTPGNIKIAADGPNVLAAGVAKQK